MNPGDYHDWTGDDLDALRYLKSKGIEEVGQIGYLSPPTWPFREDFKTTAAINYLCDEWDYVYGPRLEE